MKGKRVSFEILDSLKPCYGVVIGSMGSSYTIRAENGLVYAIEKSMVRPVEVASVIGDKGEVIIHDMFEAGIEPVKIIRAVYYLGQLCSGEARFSQRDAVQYVKDKLDGKA